MFEELRKLVQKDFELHHLALQNNFNSKEDSHSTLPCYRVPHTGAICDTRSAIQVLMRYCSHLPKAGSKISRPLFWHIRHSDDMFQCALLLPESVPPNLRCYISNSAHSKRIAKGLVALQCIQKLHQHHQLNDYLRSNSRLDQPSLQKLGRSALAADEEGPTISVAMKYIPDALIDKRGYARNGPLHVYAFELLGDRPVLPKSALLLNSLLDALSFAGLALPAKLPEDELTFEFILKKLPIRVRPRYLECVNFSSEDMLHIQRYHRAILCWETVDDMVSALPAEMWTRSSGGLNYFLIPLHKERPFSSFSSQFNKTWGWLKRAADEAQLLVNNLIKHARQTPSEDSRMSTHYRKEITSEGVIVSHHYGLFSVPVPEEPKKLTDVMMEIRGKRIEYHEYFLRKGKITEERINELHRDSSFELMPVRGVHIKCSAENLLTPPNREIDTSCSVRNVDGVRYLLPEMCFEIGSLHHYSCGILFPCIIWRVQSVFIAHECLRDIHRLFDRNREGSSSMKACSQKELRIPSLTLILEAITPRMALETIDCERLEMLGDSVIKLLISMRLHATFPEADEGELSVRRATLGIK